MYLSSCTGIVFRDQAMRSVEPPRSYDGSIVVWWIGARFCCRQFMGFHKQIRTGQQGDSIFWRAIQCGPSACGYPTGRVTLIQHGIKPVYRDAADLLSFHLRVAEEYRDDGIRRLEMPVDSSGKGFTMESTEKKEDALEYNRSEIRA
ncbi:hypothetical protein GCK32_006424 [Trichostrongylus colubriformis]|uniref:Uncharacterized protein n=1 Tax=Trichostrongylus colubriformis TaxID=6319 RepID=A0AAN8IS06_TRICO